MPQPYPADLSNVYKKVLAFNPVYYLPLSDAQGSSEFVNLAGPQPATAGVKHGLVAFGQQSWNGLFYSAISLNGDSAYVSVDPASTQAQLPIFSNATRILSFSIANRYLPTAKVPLMEMMYSTDKFSVYALNRRVYVQFGNNTFYSQEIGDLYTTWHTLYVVTNVNTNGTGSINVYLDGAIIISQLNITLPTWTPASTIFGASHGATIQADKTDFRRLLLSEICFFDTAFSHQKINTFEFVDVPFLQFENEIIDGGIKSQSFTAEVNHIYTVSGISEAITVTPPIENVKSGDKFYITQYTMGTPVLIGELFALEDAILACVVFDGWQWINVYPGAMPFNFRWEYNSQTYYNRGNVVTYAGSLYLYTNYTPTKDNPVSDTDFWIPLSGAGNLLIPALTGPSNWLAGQLMSFENGIYFANDDITITDPPEPTNTGNADLLYIGPPANVLPKTCTLILPYGIDLLGPAGTAIVGTLIDQNNYIKDAGFLGDIHIDGDPATVSASGDITFVPDSSKVYYIEIFGNAFVDATGNTELSWPMNGGINGMYAEGSYAPAGKYSIIQSGLKRMPGSWGETGPLQAGAEQDAIIEKLVIRITQRDA